MTHPFSKRSKLARRYEASLMREKELLAEYAASCRYYGRPVPSELGEVLGVVEQHIRNFQQIKQILLETTSGIGAKPIIDRFMKESAEGAAVVTAFLERNRAA